MDHLVNNCIVPILGCLEKDTVNTYLEFPCKYILSFHLDVDQSVKLCEVDRQFSKDLNHFIIHILERNHSEMSGSVHPLCSLSHCRHISSMI